MKKQSEELKIIQEKFCSNCSICNKSNIPVSVWENLSPNCKLEGFFFQEREKIKHIIRKQKEELLVLEIESKEKPQKDLKRIKKEIEKIVKNIEKYKKYGSENW